MKVFVLFISTVLFSFLLQPVLSQTDQEVKDKFVDCSNSSHPYPCLIFVPPNYDPSVPSPLVVWLHGIGERGKANGVQLIRTPVLLGKDVVQSVTPAFILAPMLPSGSWDPANVKSLVELVATQYNIDMERLYITGFSWGSMGTWNTLVAYPTFFKRAVPIAGGPWNNPDPAILRPVEIWTFHGEKDGTVNWSETRDFVAKLVADGQDVIFTHEPQRNHEDAYVWTNYNTSTWLLQDPPKNDTSSDSGAGMSLNPSRYLLNALLLMWVAFLLVCWMV